MKCIPYQLIGSQQTIFLHIKKKARKNIIMRPIDTQNISINIPAWLQEKALLMWLNNHEDLLLQTLATTPMKSAFFSDGIPHFIFYRGEKLTLMPSENQKVSLNDNVLFAPLTHPNAILIIRQFLQQQAHAVLLPKLLHHAQYLNLHPKAVALSQAKTFWGVCRHTTGIRLNWRLICAPDEVIDYVCIHELCHLVHANHSRAFWDLVNQHTPHTLMAKKWLKENSHALFVLG